MFRIRSVFACDREQRKERENHTVEFAGTLPRISEGRGTKFAPHEALKSIT